jgi:PAS domain S-box-containing protein
MSNQKKSESTRPLESERSFDGVSLLLKDRALAATAEGITIADLRQPDQPLIYANKGFERLTLYPIAEILGRNCRFLQGPDSDPQVVETIRTAIKDRRECVVELLNYRKDGKPFWNRLSLTPVRGESGETTHYIGVQSDVTARRNAEKALQIANRELENANHQMHKNLKAAARIQQALLPQSPPELDRFHFAWLYEPSEVLAGDTLNFFPLEDNYIALYIVDVSGHGVTAALLSVTLSHWLSPSSERSVLHNPKRDQKRTSGIVPPAEVAEILNRQFPMDLDTAQYFTILYGIIDVKSGELRYVSAGSPPIVHLPKDHEPKFLYAAGYPIGISDEPDYEEKRLQLNPGDRLYLYTDGIPDAMNRSEIDFGMDRLGKVLSESRELTLDQSLGAVIDQLRDWMGDGSFQDDVTFLGVEVMDL